MTIIYNSKECWKIEKVNLENNLYCYAFTCPCLFQVQFTAGLFNSSVLYQRFINFDNELSKKSLWAIFRSDVYYHAVLLSELVCIEEKDKINKYIEILNPDKRSPIESRHIHNFSRLYYSENNEPLPRSKSPLLLEYFGDANSANSRCIYLASIYNTLLENTFLYNNSILQPSFLENMQINYIVPKIPTLKINIYSNYFYLFIFIFIVFYFYFFKNSGKNNTQTFYQIFVLTILILIFYKLYRFFVLKHLIYKSADIITESYDLHMGCHHSCQKMFKNKNLDYNFKDQSFLLKDNKYNEIDFNGTFKNKNLNPNMLSNAVEYLRDDCNFECGNNTAILILNIFNNETFTNIPRSSSLLVDSILHLYFISKQDEKSKKEYYSYFIKYFDISVL